MQRGPRSAGNNTPRDIMVVFPKVLRQMVYCAALTGAVSDQDDFIRGQQIFCDVFVERFFLWYTFTPVVGLFLMNQVMVKAERVVGTDCVQCFRDIPVVVLIHVCGVMIDHHYHAVGLDDSVG